MATLTYPVSLRNGTSLTLSLHEEAGADLTVKGANGAVAVVSLPVSAEFDLSESLTALLEDVTFLHGDYNQMGPEGYRFDNLVDRGGLERGTLHATRWGISKTRRLWVRTEKEDVVCNLSRTDLYEFMSVLKQIVNSILHQARTGAVSTIPPTTSYSKGL